MLNGVPRILIVRFSAIGDVVRTLPALHALRDHFPHAQIDWAVEPKSREVLADHPALDQVLVFERPEGIWRGAREFRDYCRTIQRARYDMVLDFHGLMKSGLVMRASRAKNRYAFAPPRSREMSHLFATHRVSLPDAHMNRIEENLALCQALGVESRSLDVVIPVPEEIQEEVEKFLTEVFHSGKRLIAAHPPVDRPEKQWPLVHWAKLADLLLADGRFEVLLTWGPGQREVAEEVQRRTRRRPLIAPQTPGLKHYVWLVGQCDLFVGGDTGPLHIASAMNVPVVGIFGGTDPRKHSPYREPFRVLYAGPENPSGNLDPAEAAPYLERISPEEAYDACIALLRS